MSGRGNRDSRGRGRGGRGRGRGRFQSRGGGISSTASTKQKEIKFFPHGAGRDQQTVTYDTVKDHIVSYVQKTYKNGQDIAVSLRDLEEIDLSILHPS